MFKIIDRYILKKYFGTFLMLLLLFIPIGITVNLAEKIGKILENQVPLSEVLIYYGHFTIYFANLLFPLFLFLAVIWFTSKMTNQTEVIALLSSGISYTRFLRPYIIGATFVCIGAFFMGMYLAPRASEGFNEFSFRYLKKGRADRDASNVFRQISPNEYIYASRFNVNQQSGTNFSLEQFDGNQLKIKITADQIKFNATDTTYTLTNYVKRTVGENADKIESGRTLDTLFTFDINELTPVTYIAQTLNYKELNDFIEREKARGSSNINRYLVERYKRWSIPVSAYILTIIAVAVSSKKRRGGMGVNLAIGISIGMVYIFFDKVFGTIAEQSDFSPFLAVWFPNIVFGLVAIYLIYASRK